MNTKPLASKGTSVASKFVLIILIYVVPLICVTFYFLLLGSNKDIEFARQEVRGDAYLRPLMKILDAVPRYAEGKDVAAVTTQIEQAFVELKQQQAQNGEALQFTSAGLEPRGRKESSPTALTEEWNSLKLKVGNSASRAEIVEASTRLLQHVRAAIVHAGDTSNLILDPDLDSYYMMDTVLNALPQAIDRFGSIAVQVGGDGSISDEMRQKLAVQAALIQELDLGGVQSKINFAFTEDPNFYEASPSLRLNVEPTLKGYAEVANNLVALLTNPAATAPEIARAANETEAAAYRLWLASVTELDSLIARRIASITSERNRGLAVAIGFLVLSTLVAFAIFSSIIRPIRGLNEAVVKVSAGDDTARAPVISRDEIGRLAGAFNTMVIDRAAVRTQLETENKKLQDNIQKLLMVVADASDGNLGVRAPVTDGALGNVADALNMMFENVGELITNAKQVSSRVAEAAIQIRKSAGELADGSEKQATHLEQTSSGVRELSDEARSVAATCAEATSAAEKAQEVAERGASIVRDIIFDMDTIRESVQVNGKKIKRLGERSMEIGGILRTITEISAQTDMLALNASIEAGRAGEHGRGFSVVAEQVRTLAERAKKATLAIEKLVADIHTETSDAVSQVEEQTTEVERGVKKVAQAGEALSDIVEVSALSRDFATRISSTATRQAAKTADMLNTVSLVADIARNSRESVGETQTTSEELSKLSAELGSRLESFSTNGQSK